MEEEKSVCLFLYSNLGKESLMKKETDMAEVKSIAKMLLMTDVNETKFSPMVVQHPFTSMWAKAQYNLSVISISST